MSSMARFGMIFFSRFVAINPTSTQLLILVYMVFSTSNAGFYSTLEATAADNQGNAVYK